MEICMEIELMVPKMWRGAQCPGMGIPDTAGEVQRGPKPPLLTLLTLHPRQEAAGHTASSSPRPSLLLM
jgi:hypothetical protein